MSSYHGDRKGKKKEGTERKIRETPSKSWGETGQQKCRIDGPSIKKEVEVVVVLECTRVLGLRGGR